MRQQSIRRQIKQIQAIMLFQSFKKEQNLYRIVSYINLDKIKCGRNDKQSERHDVLQKIEQKTSMIDSN